MFSTSLLGRSPVWRVIRIYDFGVTYGPIKPTAELLLNGRTPIVSGVVKALSLHVTEGGTLKGFMAAAACFALQISTCMYCGCTLWCGAGWWNIPAALLWGSPWYSSHVPMWWWWVSYSRHARKSSELPGMVQVLGSDLTHSCGIGLDNLVF